jgi:hypothetical protein
VSETGAVTKAEIGAAFEGMERTIKRETVWMPIVVSVAFGTSLGLVLWNTFTGGDESGWGISHAIILVFAILQVWTFWDLDARRRTLALKYDTAAGLLDHTVEHGGWTWGESKEVGSVELNREPEDTDEEDETTEK